MSMKTLVILNDPPHDAEAGCCVRAWTPGGIAEDHLVKDARRSTPDELADWTLWADKVITF